MGHSLEGQSGCVSSHDRVTNYKRSSQPKGLVCMTMCKHPIKGKTRSTDIRDWVSDEGHSLGGLVRMYDHIQLC